MDWSKVSRSQWFVVGGTIVAVVGALFLDWYSVSVGPFTASVGAWDANAIGKLAVLGSLLMLAGAVLMFVPNTPQLPIPLPQALLIAAAFTALMVIFEFIDHHSHTAIGLWLTLVGALVGAYGAYEMGGRVRVPSGSSSS
ncbi:MAG TPA: hypothetical protein VGL44_10135 [Gaiellales bacterium]|jgi:hypothetical protein